MLIGQRYQVMSLLGEGGMGGVYRALDRLTGHEVALKKVQLHPRRRQPGTPEPSDKAARSSPALRTFRLALAHEFRTLATLRHPNIVGVLDYGFDAEREPFFTMQLLEQPRDLVSATRGADVPEKLAILAQLLRALVYLHRHNIIHRDLKPSNVLVVDGADGPQVKLVDFGIASPRGTAVELSGTLAYMAPELLTGQPPSPTSDLYAVGMLLYQMLVGRTPYPATGSDPACTPSGVSEGGRTVLSPDWTLDSQAFTASVEPTAVRPGELRPRELAPFGDRLAALILSLLAPDPALRVQRAELALGELSAIMQELTGAPLATSTAEIRESFLQAAELVGRQQELAALEAALSATAVGRGGLLLVGGESGVGKSRLLDELRTLALVRGIRTLRGQAISNGGTAYQLFAEALAALALCVEFSDQDAAVLKEVIAELPAILGRSVPEAPGLNAKESQERVRRVLLQTLTPTSEPVLLLLEDVHWAPAESRELLRALAARAAEAPLLIVASFRDDEFPALPAELPMAQRITLRRLDAPAILQLSQSMLGEAGGDPALLAFLARETEGNALFIVEVLRALAEEAGGLDEIAARSLPQRVSSGGIQAVVQRRLDRAPPWTRELLKLAAVSGRRIDLRLLASIDGRLDGWLQACLDAAILEVRESEWRFAHDKLREALLSSLAAPELTSLHRRLGAALEQAYPQGERPLRALADHFERGGDAVKAALYASQAGSKALRSGALQEALTLLERAIALQDQTQAPAIERAATLRRLSRTLLGLGRTPESIACVHKALSLLGQPIPRQPAARWLALAQEAGVELRHRFLGVQPETSPDRQAALRELLTLIRGTNESLFITNGHHDQLLLIILRALHAAERVDDLRQQVNFLSRLGYAAYLAPLHRLGRFYLRRAAHLGERAHSAGDHSGFYAMSGYFHTAEGQWEASLDCFTRWIAAAARNAFGEQEALGHSSRAASCLLRGDLAGTLVDGDACLRIGQRMRNPIYIGSGFGWRALVQLRQGELAAAYKNARDALAQVLGCRDPYNEMSANCVLSYAAVSCGYVDEAAAQIDAGLARMRRLLPAAPSHQVVYSCMLLASLELVRQQPAGPARAAAAQRLRQVLLRVVQFASRFPIGWAQVFLGVGHYLQLQGQGRAALAVLAAGLPSARRYRMRYDEGLLHLGCALVDSESAAPLLSSTQRHHHLEAACAIFTAIGTQRELAAARQLLTR